MFFGANLLLVHDVCSTTSAQTGEQKNGCHDTKDEIMVRDTISSSIRHYYNGVAEEQTFTCLTQPFPCKKKK